MSARGTLAIVLSALLLALCPVHAAWSQAKKPPSKREPAKKEAKREPAREPKRAPARGAQAKKDLFTEGVDWYRAGNYAEAQRVLREYVQAAAEKGGSEAGHLGEAYFYLGLTTPVPKLAEGYFLAVAQRYPTSPVADGALARLAHLYAALGNFSEARKQWRALATDYPLSRFGPEVDLRIGQIYFAEGQWEPGYDAFRSGFSKMKTYQRAARKGANLRDLEGEYVYWLGRTLVERGAYGEARKYLTLVLLDYPNHPLEPLALYQLARSYQDEGNEKEARGAWRRFSESVRNTSLEAVAENPNLVAVARARESGALRRPEEARAAGADAGGDKAAVRGAPAGADEVGGGQALRGERPAPEDRGGPEVARPKPETPSEDVGLRAPEPGRPGGVVRNEPLGRRVEEPAAEAGSAEGEPAHGADARREGQGDVAAGGKPAVGPKRGVKGPPPATAVGGAAEGERTVPEAGAVKGRTPARAEAPTGVERAAAGATDEEREARERALEAQALDRGQKIMAGEPLPERAAPATLGAAPRDTLVVSGAELEPLPEGTVYLQLGAFSSAQSAANLSKSLRKRRFQPEIHSGLVNGQGYYRVRIGPYELPRDRSLLEAMRADLRKSGFEPIVMEKEPSG